MEIYFLSILVVISIYLNIHYHERLFKTWKERLIIHTIIFVTMMAWEFTSKNYNIWLFTKAGFMGWFPFGLPIELYLFYIVLPYFGFTFYELLHLKFDKKRKN
jgi:hypothetical protein